MKICNIPKTEVANLVAHLKKAYQVFGPKERKTLKGQFVKFDELTDGKELVMEYTTTVLPPKKYFMPPQETLLHFEIASQKATATPAVSGPRVLLGVHPCDMTAIRYLDWAFTHGNPEANWIERRNATTIFGVTQVPDDQCFSNSVKSNDPEQSYDGFFFDNGANYTVALYTEKGEKALAGFAAAKPGTQADLDAGKKNFLALSERQTLKVQNALGKVQAALKAAADNPEWESVAKRCLSCGSCTVVCPTCYCFDVDDVPNLTLTEGDRNRYWDSCQLHDFSTVAGGHTFRSKRENRAKHRVYRKFNYLNNEGEGRHAFCVGCGRCNRACTADINIVEIVNNITK